MVDGKRRYKSDRKDYKISVKLSEKDMDILKAALKRTGMTASAYIRELIRTGGNIDTSYPEDRARVIRVIAGIANNINQVVKLGNSQGRKERYQHQRNGLEKKYKVKAVGFDAMIVVLWWYAIVTTVFAAMRSGIFLGDFTAFFEALWNGIR